jgi:hypothetical protein
MEMKYPATAKQSSAAVEPAVAVVVCAVHVLQDVALLMPDFQLPLGQLIAPPFTTGVNHPGIARQAAALVLKGGEVKLREQGRHGLKANP